MKTLEKKASNVENCCKAILERSPTNETGHGLPRNSINNFIVLQESEKHKLNSDFIWTILEAEY